MVVHDFHRSLQGSMTDDGDNKTELILRGYFGAPNDFSIDWSPRKRPFGHDCEVTAWGDVYTIEEKRRTKDYGDELLEDISNDSKLTPGWTRKCGNVDYVLFVYPARWEILPGGPLCLAFVNNREKWHDQYGHRAAQNKFYRTLNIPIPTAELRFAMEGVGSPPCPHCDRPVGRFQMRCDNNPECPVVTCCAIGESWVCDFCTGDDGRA